MPSNEKTSWRAPARVNIIGEHIDYIGGTVLPFACDIELIVTASPSTGPSDFGEAAKPFVDGIQTALRDAEVPVFEKEGTIASDIPVGAGLSSSTALACALALALSDGVRPTPEVVLEGERIATGVPGGLMDQTAILLGRKDHALLLDCATGAVDHIRIDPAIGFIVVDTGTRRKLSDGRYAQRRAELESGDPKRVRHAEREQARVYNAVDAIRAGDAASLGALLSESHASLRDDFEVSSVELDAAVEQATSHPACHGARLMGAGFAGCVLAVTDAGAEEDFLGAVDLARVVHAVDGAGWVQ